MGLCGFFDPFDAFPRMVSEGEMSTLHLTLKDIGFEVDVRNVSFKTPERLHTERAKAIANERLIIMEAFLNELRNELGVSDD